jgi:hypothetical protein
MQGRGMSTESEFYVFREGRRSVAGAQLLAKLRESLGRAADESGWTDALLRAGELECALDDAGSPEAKLMERVTDECAEMLVQQVFRRSLERIFPEKVPEKLTVATPEGFAYYALHPMRYADASEQIEVERDAVVVGIRSIGTTLSAIVAAALRARGKTVTRITVRPEGHPFDRTLRWSDAQLAVVRGGSGAGARFVIVDEGPGLSGSSFLSVAEALCDAGVSAERIVLMPSYPPNTSRFRARDAEQRWSKFRCVAIGDGRRPEGEWIGGGRWRERFLANEEDWPGAWTTMERSKFVSLDQQTLWKFEGIGAYGEKPRTNAIALAEAGWGAPMVQVDSGFSGYRLLKGTTEAPRDLNAEIIKQIAAYCSFRAQNFAGSVAAEQHEDLTTMLRVNYEREFEYPVPPALSKLEVVQPTVCDAKMSPHEWLRLSEGRWLKLDATTHGDDHFFPGPCDIAWDLAGAIVEWDMDDGAKAQLLGEYRQASGNDAAGRIDGYVLAYSVFRFAWSKMAASAMKATPDEQRLLREYRKYCEYAKKLSAVSASS